VLQRSVELAAKRTRSDLFRSSLLLAVYSEVHRPAKKAGEGWVIEVMSRKRETRIREDPNKLARAGHVYVTAG
jgi:hypothetical protein